MFFHSKVLRLSLLLAALACGSDSSGKSPTDPLNLNGNPGLLTNGSFTATINGTKWSATGQAIVTRTAGNGIGIAGVSPSYAITIGLANVAAPGTIQFTPSAGSVAIAVVGSANGMGWGTGQKAGIGGGAFDVTY